MREDDDSMHGIDLTAWGVPPPRADLAESVVARMHEAAAVSPVTTTMLAAVPSRRRWWLVGGGLGVAAAAAIVVIIGAGSHREDTHGSILAEHAQHLDLGDASADLDPGATVRWQRDRDTTHVEQARGIVAWKVDVGQQLVIDPGAMGASIEATGASLRVEVQMNHADGRVIAGSAITAAIAAIVTVVVYEGHVNVRNAGQTITVAPGATVQVTLDKPPHEPLAVGATVPAPDDDPVRAAVAGEMLIDCEAIAMPLDDWKSYRECGVRHLADHPVAAQHVIDRANMELGIEAAMVQIRRLIAAGDWRTARMLADGTEMSSRQHYKVERLLADVPCGQADLIASARRDAKGGLFGDALNKLEKDLTCHPDRQVEASAIVAACNASGETHAGAYLATRAASDHVSVIELCLRVGVIMPSTTPAPTDVTVKSADAPKTPKAEARKVPQCDANALHDKGLEQVNMGQFAAALATFEQALACKQSSEVRKLAFLAACNSKNASKARLHYNQLSPLHQRELGVICVRQGIDVTKSDAAKDTAKDAPKSTAKDAPKSATKDACDPVEWRDKGVNAVNMGQFAMALGMFEQSLACKDDEKTVRLAYLAACNSKNTAKGKHYYALLPAQLQKDVQVVCIRNGIKVP